MPRTKIFINGNLNTRKRAVTVAVTDANNSHIKGSEDCAMSVEQNEATRSHSYIADIEECDFQQFRDANTSSEKGHKMESTVMVADEQWEPANWKEFLSNLRLMREKNEAPIDTMGCEMSIEGNALPEVYRYQCLISLMLSSQTKDEITYAAMQRLIAKGLNVDNIVEMSEDDLAKLIYPVGFWRSKARFIKTTTQILKEQYNGDIPNTVEQLCELKGVGPKMAHICMSVAWNKITGIGVDTHVHRISNRIGWVRNPTTTPENTRQELESWLPKDLWGEINHLMVGFGQTICFPTQPNCSECLNRDICPASRVRTSLETIEGDVKDISDVKDDNTSKTNSSLTNGKQSKSRKRTKTAKPKTEVVEQNEAGPIVKKKKSPVTKK